MVPEYSAPGVYIEEIATIPKAVLAVPTAVPLFVGYTEKASAHGQSLVNRPRKITSLAEYHRFFGAAFQTKFVIQALEDPKTSGVIKLGNKNYLIDFAKNNKALLYPCIRFFFDNGGRDCYVVSVGTYGKKSTLEPLKQSLLGVNEMEGLNSSKKEAEPTLILVPDALNLSESECYKVYKNMLQICSELQNRLSIFDIHGGFLPRNRTSPGKDVIAKFRGAIGEEFLSYGAAYYPWLHTTTFERTEVDMENLQTELKVLGGILPESKAKQLINQFLEKGQDDKSELHNTLETVSPTYKKVMDTILEKLNLLPPSAALAGIYARVDASSGVWKAPANVALNGVTSPAVQLSHEDQQDLNEDVSGGKSVNAIRFFPGKGTLVWGARTLDGNNPDLKYVPVRRTLIMIEESIKNAIEPFVFEPNDANTWASVEQMISNFLRELWTMGALAGAKEEQAFAVKIGQGISMTQTDIDEGRMRIIILVALQRPAEFRALQFALKMEDS